MKKIYVLYFLSLFIFCSCSSQEPQRFSSYKPYSLKSEKITKSKPPSAPLIIPNKDSSNPSFSNDSSSVSKKNIQPVSKANEPLVQEIENLVLILENPTTPISTTQISAISQLEQTLADYEFDDEESDFFGTFFDEPISPKVQLHEDPVVLNLLEAPQQYVDTHTELNTQSTSTITDSPILTQSQSYVGQVVVNLLDVSLENNDAKADDLNVETHETSQQAHKPDLRVSSNTLKENIAYVCEKFQQTSIPHHYRRVADFCGYCLSNFQPAPF